MDDKKLIKGKAWLAFCAAMYTTIITIMPAFADTGDMITEQITSGLAQIYKIITAVVLPIAVIALAICGFNMLMHGGERAGEQAKSNFIKIIIALAIVYMAPVLIKTIIGWFSNSGNGALINDVNFSARQQ